MLQKPDLTKFFLHAFFGFILGFFAGYTIAFFVGFFFTVNELWVAILVGGFYGTIAGIKNDDFWDAFSGGS